LKAPLAPLPLPTRDGVGPSCVALPAGPWPTIAACLRERFAHVAPSVWAARIDAGDVVDEHGIRITPMRPHRPGLRVYYYRTLASEARVPFAETVLFRDDHLVVADKPHFLPVTPSGRHLHETLLVRLKRNLGIDTLVPLHRIDRETAGLVMFSIDPATRGRYARLFAERAIVKSYECAAPWRNRIAWPLVRRSRLVADTSQFMRTLEDDGEANAETRIELIEQLGGAARYRLQPLTGRRHQLRVHCAALDMPIFGDRIYPQLQPVDTDDPALPLQLLARSLEFTDPVTGEARRFESRLRLLPLDHHQ
jgi:tRNA pseudouridine32 synthase / 23S rRNA pseudouridine746 synthase